MLTILQELELLSSLEAHGAVPLKYAYLGDGYLNWINIAEESRLSGGVEHIERALLSENLPFIFGELKKEHTNRFNIVDLGCGDGKPIESVFKYLKEKKYLEKYQVTYVPIDISKNLLDHATKYITGKFDVMAKPTMLDFEKGGFPQLLISENNAKSHNYCFFLGNTLGNFSNTERILSNFKDSLFSTDYLIIGNELSNFHAIKKMIQYYKNKSGYGFAVNILKHYGYNDSYGEYNIRWNESKRQIEGYLTLNRDVEFNIANSKIKFEKNEEILLVISKKFVEQDMIRLFNEIGFRIHLFTTNKQKRHCLLSINPSRFKTY